MCGCERHSILRHLIALTIAAILALFSPSLLPAAEGAPQDSKRVGTTPGAATDTQGTSEENRSSEERPSQKSGSRVRSQVVIIGPDGQRQVFEMDDDTEQWREVGGRTADGPSVEEKLEERQPSAVDEPHYMIGAVCTPVEEVFRRQLKLDQQGLLVRSVYSEFPAAKAGIEEGDILLSMGDTKLKDVNDLIRMVADSEGQAVSVTLLRQGEKVEVAVTPEKLTAQQVMESMPHEESSISLPGFWDEAIPPGTRNSIRIHSFGPALHLQGQTWDEIEKSVQSLRSRIGADPRSRTDSDSDEPAATDRSSILRRISDLEEQLNQLRERLKSAE